MGIYIPQATSPTPTSSEFLTQPFPPPLPPQALSLIPRACPVPRLLCTAGSIEGVEEMERGHKSPQHKVQVNTGSWPSLSTHPPDTPRRACLTLWVSLSQLWLSPILPLGAQVTTFPPRAACLSRPSVCPVPSCCPLRWRNREAPSASLLPEHILRPHLSQPKGLSRSLPSQ